VNPFCLLAYTAASWKFFQTRVLIEEASLLNFFGDQYYQYQQKVPTGLPFIKGYE
jgi:protein-S-isoprenylcysteine O-methyltransferase